MRTLYTSQIRLHLLPARRVIRSRYVDIAYRPCGAGALPGFAHAAVIRGMVVENQTGHPLARSVVVASPVAGTPGGAKSMRTDLYGGFVFEDLPAGAFLVSAARKGFASVSMAKNSGSRLACQ